MTAASTPKPDEISESLDQWVKFCSTGPNAARGGEIIQEPGLIIACCRTSWPMGNVAAFTTPVVSVADLARRTDTVYECLTARSCSGVFFIADNLVGSLGSRAADVFARYGYGPIMTVMGMAANALSKPARPLPTLRYRAVCDSASRRIVAELNAVAYEVPLEWGDDYDEHTDVWSHGAVGIIGYMDDRPASCAVTVPLDGCLYMALVATAPEFRRLGCAEAVMRRSLQDASRSTGLIRTVLHASPLGRPLYSQMGYHDTIPFTVYAQAEGM
jgi:GNAT superfamily N-acetyltransferase